MTNSTLLTKDDLTELFKINGFLIATYGTNPKFYAKFLNESIKNISNIDMEYYKEALGLSNQNPYSSYGSVSQDVKDFVKLFDNKIPLPESFTIFKLFGDFYASQRDKATYKEIISFLEKKVGEKNLHSMMENYLCVYNNDNSSILNHWFELTQKNPSWTDVTKAQKIINQNVKEESFNTSLRRLNLKMLCFLNQFIDNKDVISKYIEDNQNDAVFLKSVGKITEKIKNLTWNDEELPLIKSKGIVGTISLDPDYFVKKHGMNRGDSERFLSSGLSFISRKFMNIFFSSTATDLMISAKTIDEYKNKEEQAIDKINKVKLLASVWKKPKDRIDDYEFFNNYFEKAILNDELNKQLNVPEPNKISGKKTKI